MNADIMREWKQILACMKRTDLEHLSLVLTEENEALRGLLKAQGERDGATVLFSHECGLRCAVKDEGKIAYHGAGASRFAADAKGDG